MALSPGFPRSLLDGPRSARLAHFRSYTVAHPLLVEAKEKLTAAIWDSEPNSLIFVVGPTGVGKTTLRNRTEQILTDELRAELEKDRGRIAVASVEAMAPESGNFSWRDLFKRLLQRLDEPLIEYKRNLRAELPQLPSPASPSPTAAQYRYGVEQALQFRRPVAVMIDEAQHLAKIASGRRLLDQLDVIKSLASQTQTVHVLFGTYDLLAFRNLNGQLSRRSIDIHFARYHAELAAQRQAFVSVVRSFARQLPLPVLPDLVSDWEFLYERSLGCVGVLKQWLARSLSVALRSGEATLTRQNLESHALSVSQVEKILSEVSEGELQLKDGDDARSRLRGKLGLTPHENDRHGVTTARGIESSKRHARLRPGERRPVRDVIGQPESLHAAGL
jgi:energy-coupling factor transporter ATP-binding protein EcfA2